MIDRDQVLHVAKLARLRVSDDEVDTMAGELSKILEHVETMNELDLEGVVSLRAVDDRVAPVREDQEAQRVVVNVRVVVAAVDLAKLVEAERHEVLLGDLAVPAHQSALRPQGLVHGSDISEPSTAIKAIARSDPESHDLPVDLDPLSGPITAPGLSRLETTAARVSETNSWSDCHGLRCSSVIPISLRRSGARQAVV